MFLSRKNWIRSFCKPKFEALRAFRSCRICCVPGGSKYNSTSSPPAPCISGKLENRSIQVSLKITNEAIILLTSSKIAPGGCITPANDIGQLADVKISMAAFE